MRCVCMVLSCATVIAVSGCGGGGLAKVTGKVTCKGQAVTGASLIFSPFDESDPKKSAGKVANAILNDQGEFTLSTHGTNDGAVVGKHRVAINFEDAYKKQPCTPPPDLVLEVKSGTNHFDIELDPASKKK